MNSDPTTSSYWEYMNMVGAMHTGHFRCQALEIDTIHLNLLMGYVQNTLSEAIITSETIPMNKKAPLVKAWNKLLWIQTDLMAKWHSKDGEQYDQLSTRATRLDAATDFRQSMLDGDGEKVQCPFSKYSKTETIEQNGSTKTGYVYARKASVVGIRIGSIESIASSPAPSTV